MRIGVRCLVDRRRFVFVGAALASQLIDAERIVDIVRVGANRMPVRHCRRKEHPVMVMRVMRMVVRVVVRMVTRSGRTGSGQHVVQSKGETAVAGR